MKRRNFVKSGLVVGSSFMVPRSSISKKKIPDYMPILREKMQKGDYVSHYIEREITKPVLLCDDKGRLNPEAVGFARTPLITANLKGHWPRKKKWNFWNFISPEFVFSITVADIDFACFCSASLDDFKTKESFYAIVIRRHNFCKMPEDVERSIHFRASSLELSMVNNGSDIKVDFYCNSMSGKKAKADFVIYKPRGFETINTVVPWSDQRFQFNSKHNCLKTQGVIAIGDKKYIMNPGECFAVQDFGRGIWPYRSYWNWGVATGIQDGDLIGVNIGSKWTTGTGHNENGIIYNGKLYKVMEDLFWDYDTDDFMKPWKIKTTYSDMVNITLVPFYKKTTKLSLGLLSTEGTCSFGYWSGTLKFNDKKIEIKNLIGWAEEFSHRW